MKSNKNMLKISNSSKLNPKFNRNKKNKALKIRCNLETKSSYNIWLLLRDEVLLVRLQEPIDQYLLPFN